jgi:hypothetical protein
MGITEAIAARAFQRLDLVDQERVLVQVERLVERGVRTEGMALALLAAVGVEVVRNERSEEAERET